MNLREKLAKLEHDQWAQWTDHLLTKLTPFIPEGAQRSFMLDSGMFNDRRKKEAAESIRRWYRQIKTRYEDLSELEKDSDRRWADKVLEVVNKHISREKYSLVQKIMFYRRDFGVEIHGCLACGAPEPDECLEDCPVGIIYKEID